MQAKQNEKGMKENKFTSEKYRTILSTKTNAFIIEVPEREKSRKKNSEFPKQKEYSERSARKMTLHFKNEPQYGFPCGSADKENACNVGDLGLIPGLG